MAETPKAQPSAFRQDLLRGIRWGTILLIAMLLSIAAYRVLSSSPAAASQAKPAEELIVAPEAAPAPETAIQVGDPVLKGPDAPAAPPLVKVRKPAAKAEPARVVEQPLHLQAPRFAPLPLVAAPKPIANSFVPVPAPEPSPAPVAAAAPVDAVVPTSVAAAAPAPAATPADSSKQSNRAVRAVRSVGRLFRLGRKDDDSKQGTAKQ